MTEENIIDVWMNFFDTSSEKIPKCPKEFVATVTLKNGKKADAREYGLRTKIWEWWYVERRDKLLNTCMVDVANSLLNQKSKIGDYWDAFNYNAYMGE
jgi:hypothetical protein